MKIEAKNIIKALSDYDKATSYVSYYSGSILGERSGLAKLRTLIATFPNKNSYTLKKAELITFAEILVDVKDIGKERHTALFNLLKKLFGLNNFDAFVRLKKHNLLEDYFDIVFAQKNPQSAARAITHLRKQFCVIEPTTLDSLFLKTEDPYHVVKTESSLKKIQRLLTNSEFEGVLNEEQINQKPISLSKAFSVLNEYKISKENLLFIAQYEDPKAVGLALARLFKHIDSIKGLHLNVNKAELICAEIIHDARELNSPYYILGATSLLRVLAYKDVPLYNEENIRLLKDSTSPEAEAEQIVINALREKLPVSTELWMDKLQRAGFFKSHRERFDDRVVSLVRETKTYFT